MADATVNGHVAGRLHDLGVRIRASRISLGMTLEDFADIGGVSLSTQKKYEKGDTTPTAEYFYRIELHGIDIADLLSGYGLAPSLTTSIRRAISQPDNEIEGDDSFVEVQEIDLAYGLGGTFTDNGVEIELHRFPKTWIERITATPASLLTFARGRGDSMQPTIQDGDMVLIDRSQRTVREQDALWALTWGEIAMIKRVRVRADLAELLSDNDRVPPDRVTADEINVVGRVIFIGRRV